MESEYFDSMNYWSNIINSIVAMFVFISSGENYVTVVYPAIVTWGKFVIIYFIPIIFVGLFTLMAMITGIFEDCMLSL